MSAKNNRFVLFHCSFVSRQISAHCVPSDSGLFHVCFSMFASNFAQLRGKKCKKVERFTISTSSSLSWLLTANQPPVYCILPTILFIEPLSKGLFVPICCSLDCTIVPPWAQPKTPRYESEMAAFLNNQSEPAAPFDQIIKWHLTINNYI